MRFKNEFLSGYLEFVNETEAPRVFHVWSALSAVAACLGRRVYFPFALGDIFANMYVLLVGPPAVKKSTSFRVTRELLKASTGVRFAPKDTGGQRQGLIAAMHKDAEEQDELLQGLSAAMETSTEGLLNENGNTTGIKALSELGIDLRDRHSLYVAASEFETFIGHNNLDMVTFLLEMWDGEDYPYKLKNSEVILDKPLLNLIAGTTPTSIAETLPAAAIGQGFMSRVILVHANKKHGSIARPKLDEKLRATLQEIFSIIFNSFEGPIKESPAAAKLLDEYYGYDNGLIDPRFVYYNDRRHIHLVKLSMVLACARLSTTIETHDIEEANAILQATEASMPDALGEYGLSPLAASKQRLVEFILAAKQPITMNILWAVMHREMKRNDFVQALADLQNANKIMLVDTNDGPAYVEKEGKRHISSDQMLKDLMAEDNAKQDVA